jgi:homoaconitase/3-isopropylmalate dehydratase large subunit
MEGFIAVDIIINNLKLNIGRWVNRNVKNCIQMLMLEFDKLIEMDAREIIPQVTWGTSPELVTTVDENAPGPDYD